MLTETSTPKDPDARPARGRASLLSLAGGAIALSVAVLLTLGLLGSLVS